MNIAHESGKRLASIGVFLRGRDMGSAVEDMQQRGAQKRVRCRRATFCNGAANSKTSSAPWRA